MFYLFQVAYVVQNKQKIGCMRRCLCGLEHCRNLIICFNYDEPMLRLAPQKRYSRISFIVFIIPVSHLFWHRNSYVAGKKRPKSGSIDQTPLSFVCVKFQLRLKVFPHGASLQRIARQPKLDNVAMVLVIERTVIALSQMAAVRVQSLKLFCAESTLHFFCRESGDQAVAFHLLVGSPLNCT
jgi:hypothetical protein